MEATKTALELRDVAQRIYQAMTAGDVSRIERHISPRYGRLVLGGSRLAWQTSQYAEFLLVCRCELRALAAGAPLILSNPEAQVQGQLGWIRDEPTLLCGGTPNASLRLAALLRWEDSEWKLVELRLSLPQPRSAEMGEARP